MKKISYIHEQEYLASQQVERIFKAAEKAHESGYSLNRFITIHYDDCADKKRPQKFIVELMEHVRKWLVRRGFPVSYLYVLENGRDKGIHAHIMLHIPVGYQVEFKKALRRWLPFKMKMPKVNFKTISYPNYGDLSPLNGVYGRLRYICKGIDPTTPIRAIKPIPQGVIMGRRWGISKLISKE